MQGGVVSCHFQNSFFSAAHQLYMDILRFCPSVWFWKLTFLSQFIFLRGKNLLYESKFVCAVYLVLYYNHCTFSSLCDVFPSHLLCLSVLNISFSFECYETLTSLKISEMCLILPGFWLRKCFSIAMSWMQVSHQ